MAEDGWFRRHVRTTCEWLVVLACATALIWIWWGARAKQYSGMSISILSQVLGELLVAGLIWPGLRKRRARRKSATTMKGERRGSSRVIVPVRGVGVDSFSQALRQLRKESGLSLAALAARSKVSKSHIGNLESGIREPTSAVARALDDGLGAEGFLTALAGEGDLVKRRALLMSMGAGALAASTGGEGLRQALMASLDATVDDWHAIAETHGQDYMTTPASEYQNQLTRDISCLRPTLSSKPELWAVACRLAALQAMTLTSLGDRSHGDRWWRTARLAGAQSGDLSVLVWVRGREAFRAAHENVDPMVVLRMSDGVDAAEAHAARAWAFARLADRRAAASAIVAARTALDRAQQATRPTIYQMAHWRLGLAESRVFALLGDRPAMRSALSDVPSDMVEWIAHREICIALSEATTGDRPSGVARAEAAIEKLPKASRISVVRNLVREVEQAGKTG